MGDSASIQLFCIAFAALKEKCTLAIVIQMRFRGASLNKAMSLQAMI
jgi:hypothetical protein